MKILLLGEYGALNGGERSYLADLRHLNELHIDVTAAVPVPSDFATTLKQMNCKLIPLQLHDPSGVKLSQAQIRLHLLESIRRVQPNIVHANSMSMSRLLGPLPVSNAVKKLGHIRDIVNASKKAVRDLNELDLIITVSNATRRFHEMQGLDPAKMVTRYNGVDTDFFAAQLPDGSIHRELNIPDDQLLFISIGQIGLRKGLDTLITGFLDHARHYGHSHLLIVGKRHSQKQESIDFEVSLHRQINASEYAGRIHFLDVRHDVHHLLNESTALVHCARQEPLGRVLLEACASGLPVIATEVGGTAEIFPHDQPHGAVIVRPDNVQQVSEALTWLSNNPLSAKKMGGLNRQIAIERFCSRRAAEQLLQLYSQLMQQEQPK